MVRIRSERWTTRSNRPFPPRTRSKASSQPSPAVRESADERSAGRADLGSPYFGDPVLRQSDGSRLTPIRDFEILTTDALIGNLRAVADVLCRYPPVIGGEPDAPKSPI